jgi:superfamily II DNA or RNA helicase
MSENCKDYITDYIIPFKKYIKNLNKNDFEIKNIADSSGVNNSRPDDKKLKLRYYQSEAIKRIIFDGYGRGVIELPTSAGKSFVIANLIHTIDQSIISGLRYLIFVPNRQLVNQFYNDLLDYGFSDKIVTMFTSTKKGEPKYNPEAQIIITNRQYLFSNIDRLPKIDAIINDEVHQSKPDS